MHIRSFHFPAFQGLPIILRIKSILPTVAYKTRHNLVLVYLWSPHRSRWCKGVFSHRALYTLFLLFWNLCPNACLMGSSHCSRCSCKLTSSQTFPRYTLSKSVPPSCLRLQSLPNPTTLLEQQRDTRGWRWGGVWLLPPLHARLFTVFVILGSSSENKDNDSLSFIDCYETKWANIYKTLRKCLEHNGPW